MKSRLLFFFVLFGVLWSNAQSISTISSAEVSFVFVNNDVAGTIAGFTSDSKIDLQNLENSSFKGSVSVETIDTGNSLRNWSIKRSKYFDADNYPKITFESTAVERADDATIVKGKLTLKGVTKTIRFRFTKNGNQLKGTTTLYSSDYGISIKSDREKNKVTVQLIFNLK